MKQAIIRVEFTYPHNYDGYKQYGYFVDECHITGIKSHASIFELSYAQELFKGINFAINFYGNGKIGRAYIIEVEEIK